jgi:hypothetical protein
MIQPIIGFGSLNVDLIFEVEDLKSLSLKGLRLDPGKEGSVLMKRLNPS